MSAPVWIVSGLPRSGTSMMMQMLDAGGIAALTDAVREADADNPKGYYEFEAVKRTKQDASWVERARGRVVKMVHVLLYDLPLTERYRVVFMRRDLEEVVRSQGVMLERLGRDGAAMEPAQLMRAYARQVEQCERWLGEQSCFEVLSVDYNRLMSSPADAVASINAFAGGGLDTGAMLAVVDPALYRQRGGSGGRQAPSG